MHYHPVTELTFCSFRGCKAESEVIIQRLIGDHKMMFGYCQFHSIIAATLFSERSYYRIEIHV